MTDPSSDLVRASCAFAELATLKVEDVNRTYHEVGAAILALCTALDRAEAAGLSCAAMRELVGAAREIHSLSPFVRRLQCWPRGYAGDFETIEHLISQVNHAVPRSIGFAVEQYCLATALAQQHRNKMQRQAEEVLRAILRSNETRAPRILILAAGASPEMRFVAGLIGERDFRAVLCDSDPGAIEFSKNALLSLGDRVVALEGDVIWCEDEIAEHAPYDLVVAGGLFDYLDDKWAKKTLGPVLNDWLLPGGKLFFTNLATKNPFRLWMRCLVDWNVIERTEQDLVDLVTSVRATGVGVEVERDRTTLALMATVRCAG